MKTRLMKVKVSKKKVKKKMPERVRTHRLLTRLPALDVLFENSKDHRTAINAIWSLYSYVWEGLPYSKADYNRGLWASLMNAGIDNAIQISDEVSLLVSEFNRYVGRADALYPEKAKKILRKLSAKLVEDLLSRNIDPWVLRSALISESLYIWRMAGLKGVGDYYKLLRGQFDMTSKFRKLQKAVYQVNEYFSDPDKENRKLIEAIVECGWALSYRDDFELLNEAK